MRYRPLFVALLLAAAPGQAADPVQTTAKVEADGMTTLTHEALIDAPATDVWTAIATPQGWMSWAVPIAWQSPDDPDVLETSYDPADKPGSPSTIRQRFTARIPGRLLAFRTIKAPQGFPHWETYQKVTSVFELEPSGKQTRLRLTSTGYPPTSAGRALISFFTKGNAETLASLQKRFSGRPATR